MRMKSNLTNKLTDFDIDSSIYRPIRLANGTVNRFISNRGGIMPSTITMVCGDAGAGKTTILCDWLGQAKAHGSNVLFISSEMDAIDFGEYGQRFPSFKDIDTYYPTPERDLVTDLDELFDMGWDIILIDSFKDLQDKISYQTDMGKREAEHWLVERMKDVKGGVEREDGENVYTAFLIIQQVLKSGKFAGSNNLKHQISASLKLVVDEDEAASYMVYTKNRRGNTHKRLYYEITQNAVVYDCERAEIENMGDDFMEKENERFEGMENTFSTLDDLLSGVPDLEEDETDAVESVEVASNGTEPTSDVPATSIDELSVEPVREALDANRGNLSATMRQLLNSGVITRDISRYYLTKFIERHDLERQTYA